jgi:hypothetical protein
MVRHSFSGLLCASASGFWLAVVIGFWSVCCKLSCVEHPVSCCCFQSSFCFTACRQKPVTVSNWKKNLLAIWETFHEVFQYSFQWWHLFSKK